MIHGKNKALEEHKFVKEEQSWEIDTTWFQD